MKNLILFLYSCLSMLVGGVGLAFLWKWFITPLGVPAISIIHAIGIALTVSFLTAVRDPKREFKSETVTFSIVFSLVALFFGYLVHLGM